MYKGKRKKKDGSNNGVLWEYFSHVYCLRESISRKEKNGNGKCEDSNNVELPEGNYWQEDAIRWTRGEERKKEGNIHIFFTFCR